MHMLIISLLNCKYVSCPEIIKEISNITVGYVIPYRIHFRSVIVSLPNKCGNEIIPALVQ
jgi:hypothetical protein